MRREALLGTLLGACALSVLALPSVVSARSVDDAPSRGTVCEVPTRGSATGLTAVQLANASAIVAEGYRLRMPRSAVVAALAVAHQESGFLRYANDGLGDDVTALQWGIAASLRLPHDAVASDAGAVGVFGQDWPWQGSLAELLDPAGAANRFYDSLERVPGWQRLSAASAAEAVQGREGYADDVPLARALLDDPAAGSPAAVTRTGFARGCVPTRTPRGEVVAPVATAKLRPGGGPELAAACGTPVVAATAGTVVVRTDQPWAGRWLVQVTTGADRLTTWYAHLRSLDVVTGQRVEPGDPLGEAGPLGLSASDKKSACGVHFEVHPMGGASGEDGVDPQAWLRRQLPRLPAGPGIAAPAASRAVSMVTANVPFTLSPARAEQQVHWLLSQSPDLLLLQEVTSRDVAAIAGRAPGHWAVWQPDGVKGGSAVVWNADRFTVQRRGVDLGYRGATYSRWMTWAVLSDTESGADLAAVALHLPTNSSKNAVMRGHYLTMTDSYQRLARSLQQDGYPVVMGADWNHPLGRTREPWSPVPMLREVRLSTNWLVGTPCSGTSGLGGRIDGFAFDPRRLEVVEQGCLARGLSDHRPVWVQVSPLNESIEGSTKVR